MKASRFLAMTRDKNRFTLPLANVRALIRETGLTEEKLYNSVFLFKIEKLMTEDGKTIELNREE